MSIAVLSMFSDILDTKLIFLANWNYAKLPRTLLVVDEDFQSQNHKSLTFRVGLSHLSDVEVFFNNW